MKFYLSGQISNNPNFMSDFEKAENTIKTFYPEAEVINPAKVGNALPELKHEEYMKISFQLIDLAEVVVMMNGWRLSCGASQEYGYAHAKGKKILFINERKMGVFE